MSLRAEHHRHLGKIWQGAKPWNWAVLSYGWSQPRRFALLPGPWRYRPIRFHLTPIHFERWGSLTEVGLCLGKRTLCVVIHR